MVMSTTTMVTTFTVTTTTSKKKSTSHHHHHPHTAYGDLASYVYTLPRPSPSPLPRATKSIKLTPQKNEKQRADPNLLHWQARSPEMIQKHPQTLSSSSTYSSHPSSSILRGGGLPRPPRYTMEEGSSASSEAMDVPVLFFGDERV